MNAKPVSPTRVASAPIRSGSKAASLLLGLSAGACFFVQAVCARPRTPAAPIPEALSALCHLDFDAGYWAGINDDTVTNDAGIFVSSWSGYALDRTVSVSPHVTPGVSDSGKTNLTGAGCVRFWIAPYWSSGTNGSGPGHYARLVEMIAAGDGGAVTLWSLQTATNGASLSLIAAGEDGPFEVLSAPIDWTAEAPWHCVALNYSPAGTNNVLFIDGQRAASGAGAGVPGVPPGNAGLIIGSSFAGAQSDVGLAAFDEVFTFGAPLSDSAVVFYYNALTNVSSVLPITQAEWEQNHNSEITGRNGLQGEFGSPAPESPCNPGGPAYLTNIVAFATDQGTTFSFSVRGGIEGMLYNVMMTTNLGPNSITNAIWTWLGQVYTCNRYTLTGQPPAQAYYRIGTTQEAGIYGSMVVAWGDNSQGQLDVPLNLTNVVQVAGGLFHSLALQSFGGPGVRGVVTAWGQNNHGQADVPPGLSNVITIAAGTYHNLALREDGTVTNWGAWEAGTFPPATLVAGLTNVTAISAGATHDFALKADGTIIVWGYTNDSYATQPSGISNVNAIAAGWGHNVLLLSNSTVFVWGDNFASLGWNVTNVPAGLSNVTAIAAGANHTLALRADGTVVAWGAGNTTNITAWGDHRQSMVPAGLSNVMAIAANGYHSLALRTDGSVLGWGDLTSPPSEWDELVAVAGAGEHGLAIHSGLLLPMISQQPASQTVNAGSTAAFNVLAFGLADLRYQWQFDSVNLPGATNSALVLAAADPLQQGIYRVVLSSAAGSLTSSVALLRVVPPYVPFFPGLPVPSTNWITTNATLTVPSTVITNLSSPIQIQWKRNGTDLPGATYTNYYIWFTPSQVGFWEGDYSVSLTSTNGTTDIGPWRIRFILPGNVAAWGADADAELERPATLTNVICSAAGEYHSVAVREDGSVTQWGAYWDGSSSVVVGPAPYSNLLSVAAGAEHDIGLRADGSVVAWGSATAYAAWVPTNLPPAKAVAAGWDHSVALFTNGTVAAWGFTNTLLGWHLTDVPSGLSNVTSISASSLHSLALKSDGTVVAWGYGPYGEATVPSDLTNAVAIAAGGQHNLALKADGTVVAWGYNGSGQCNVPTGLSNVMAVAAGWAHGAALRNDGSVVCWGSNSSGETNTLANISPVRLLAAGGDYTLASQFSPLVQYNVDVSKDLLLIYNSSSSASSNVCAYYLKHRPMVSAANVLPISVQTSRHFYLTNTRTFS